MYAVRAPLSTMEHRSQTMPCVSASKDPSSGYFYIVSTAVQSTQRIQLARVLCKTGIIPIPVRRLQPADVDELVLGELFELVEAKEIYASASSYFVVARKPSESSSRRVH